jgi:hypothetical protein
MMIEGVIREMMMQFKLKNQSAVRARQTPDISAPAVGLNDGMAPMTAFREYHYAKSPLIQRKTPSTTSATPGPVHQRAPVASASRNDTGLPNQLKAGVEALSGMAMDQVRVHYNSAKPAQLNALAYARGNEIHLGPGQERHLPHEAWHVVQQAQGRVKPTMQMKSGVPVNDDADLEAEADLMGARALGLGQMHSQSNIGTQKLTKARSLALQNHPTGHIIQREVDVNLDVDEDQKKKLVANGTVDKFKNGSKAGKNGWIGVQKYRARYKITSKDGEFENSDDVGPLKNSFTNPEAGHVLGRQNGGNGKDTENIFAQDGGTNNGKYKVFENKMRTDLKLYKAEDKVEFICYLVGNTIVKGTIADAGLSSASDISSDSDNSSDSDSSSGDDMNLSN